MTAKNRAAWLFSALNCTLTNLLHRAALYEKAIIYTRCNLLSMPTSPRSQKKKKWKSNFFWLLELFFFFWIHWWVFKINLHNFYFIDKWTTTNFWGNPKIINQIKILKFQKAPNEGRLILKTVITRCRLEHKLIKLILIQYKPNSNFNARL